MAISTLTSKGQVTIPKKVREQLHLRSGDKLDFRLEEDGTIRVYPIARKVAEVFGLLAEKTRHAYSSEEIPEKLGEAFKKGKA